MNRFFLITLAALASCADSATIKSTDAATDSAARYNMENLKELAQSGDVVTEKMNELTKLSPLSLSRLSGTLPAEAGPYQRTPESSTSNAEGYGMCAARYRTDAGADANVTVYDCAGADGATLYGQLYWDAVLAAQNSSGANHKIVDFNGGKAVEAMDTTKKTSSLTFMANDRLLVVVESRTQSTAALRTLARQLEFKL